MNFLKYIKIGSLTGLLLWMAIPSLGQQNKPIKVQACYDSSAVPELFSKVPVGFLFTYPDNKKEVTNGFLRGRVRWKKLQITSPQGALKGGILFFDPQKVWNNGHKLDFKVRYADTVLSCELALPYVKNIHFNLYTDSLKRDVDFYLNIEGRFSSGKTYPLDAQSVRFQASAGRLRKNILLLPGSDTAVKAIRVKGIFKWDESLADSCVIPVKKQGKEVTLPTEKELLDRWKKKRR